MSKIIVSLYGGLGNQLFQYATGYALSRRLNCDLVFDLAWFDSAHTFRRTTPRKFSLAPFHLSVEQQNIGLKTPWRKINGLIFKKSKQTKIFREKTPLFDPVLFENQAPLWLDGYWQSPKYFEKWSAEIKEKIGTPIGINKRSEEMLFRIVTSESICVHVRRGDYVSNKKAQDFHGLCSLGYYREGVNRTRKNFKTPHCFVFSDDLAWVRENFDVGVPFTAVDINGPDEAHQDLWLMAACKNFVIANSSLSWWGAWLGRDPNKEVVAPFEWFKNKPDLAKDLIPESWIRI